MIITVLAGAWLTGWVLAIHPIYKAILRCLVDYNGRSSRPGVGDVIWSSILSTVAGLVWPLAIPLTLSRLVYARPPLINARAEVDRTREDLAADAELRRRLREARNEIEVTSRDAEEEPSGPFVPSRRWA
jgi:hypothetical protein